jgi:RNA polymerase sigma-70 factor (ECF subfamily)
MQMKEDDNIISLIKSAQSSDNLAFESVINSIKQDLYKIAITRLQNEDDVADALQNTILKAYENINKLKYPQYFKTWIIKILINECNKIHNSNIVFFRNQKINLNIDKSYYNLEKESQLGFESIIDILTTKERTIFVLFYSCDLTVLEIARLLKKNPNTIKSILHRGKEKLKKYKEVLK